MKVDGISLELPVNISNISDILSRLSVGDTVRAKVLEFTTNELLLKLADGTTFPASTLAAVDVKKGDYVDFSVKGKNDNQVILEILKKSALKPQEIIENDIKKQLIELDIKPDVKNIGIAKEIKANNLPLNKEVFKSIMDSLMKFSQLTPAKAAFLASNNLNIAEKNIETLNYLTEGKLKIGLKLEDLFSSLNKVNNEAFIKNLESELVKFDNLKTGLNTDTKADIKTAFQLKVETVLKQAVVPGNPQQAKVDINLRQDQTVANKLQNNENEAVSKLLNEALKAFGDNGQKNIIQALNLPEKLDIFLQSDKNSKLTISERLLSFLKGELENLEKLPVSNKEGVSSFLTEFIGKIKYNKFNLDQGNINEKTAAQLNDDKAAKSVLNKVLDSFFAKVDSSDLKNDLNVRNTYRDILHKLDVIRDSVVQSALTNKEDILSKIDNLQSNMKFINDINNHNTYFQIPINIWDKNTTGELYILKRDSKKRKIDADNATMFLSLDTEHIGRIDSLISINKKKISINIRVEEQQIINFIKENYKELYESLSDKGYKLVDIKYRLIDEELNVLNVKNIINKELESNRVSIDYRL